jgi:hypothetical protein
MKNTNKWLAILGVGSAMLLSQQAQAIPTGTLTLSDNNGNTTGAIATSGGVATYNGILGNWDINVSTGIGGGTASFPTLDLNSVDRFTSGLGNVLTITFTLNAVGPLAGTIYNGVGGTASGTSDVFQVLVNGVPVTTSLAFNSNPFSGSQSSGLVTGALPSTISIVATLTANPGGITSFDDNASFAPDGGATVMLLGAALSGLCLFRKKIMV